MSKATYQPLPQTDSLSEPENDGTSGDILLEVPDQTSRQKKKSLKSDEEKSAKRKKTQITLKDLQVIKTLLPYLWCDLGTKIRVVVALICLVLAKVFKVLVPIFYKYVVDPLNDTSGVITIPILWILIYGIASLLSTVFGNLRDAIFVNVQQNAMKEAAIDTFVHLHKLSLRFHLHRKTGGILRAIDRGKEAIETLMYAFLFSIGPTLLEICFTWFILFLQYKFWYFLVTFITVGGYIVFTIALTEWRIKVKKKMNQYENKANDEAVDSLLNFETVKYFNNEEHEIRRYRAILEKWNEANLKSQWALAGLNSGQALIVSISLVVVMILAAFEVKNGTMSLGDFVLVNTFLLQLYTPLNLVANTYRITKTALVDLENMFSLLQEPIDVKDMENAPELEVTRAEIEFQDVTFSYESDKAPVLRGVSFKVPGGTKLAIVGATGAGKSTISRLLFRFYDVNSGSILIDGQDISRVTQSSLRKAIGMVPQDTVLFNETIRYNIAYGKVDATEDEIIQAAKMAQIHNFIMECPDRYETLVGERGLRLSGGERQRVGIARAILKNPPILIFDEATSALDSATEKEIQNSLAEVAKGKTTIVIAHRLSTIVDADRIIVLKDGVIVESGTHTELLMKGGEYARLWAIQSQQQQQKKSQNNNSADLLITL